MRIILRMEAAFTSLTGLDEIFAEAKQGVIQMLESRTDHAEIETIELDLSIESDAA